MKNFFFRNQAYGSPIYGLRQKNLTPQNLIFLMEFISPTGRFSLWHIKGLPPHFGPDFFFYKKQGVLYKAWRFLYNAWSSIQCLESSIQCPEFYTIPEDFYTMPGDFYTMPGVLFNAQSSILYPENL